LIAVPGCDRDCAKCEPPIELSPELAANSQVSVEVLQSLMPAGKRVVGFDIDDTVFFTSPTFMAAVSKFHFAAEYLGKPIDQLPEGERPLAHQFWNWVNDDPEHLSTPKAIASRLLAMHQARIDTVVFVTPP
jgi:acid phosphatase class B